MIGSPSASTNSSAPHRVNAACGFRAPKSQIRLGSWHSWCHGTEFDREPDPDRGASAVRDRRLVPLEGDLLRQPVDRQRDGVADPMAGDLMLDPLPAEFQGQTHDRLQRIALPPPLGRRVGLADRCPEAPVAQPGNQL